MNKNNRVLLQQICLSFLLHDQKKRNQRKVTGCVSGVAKNISHSNFGGDKTRCAQTISPLTEILVPFLTPDTMPEVAAPTTRIVKLGFFFGTSFWKYPEYYSF